jgi:hypothetical protein
MFLLNYYFLLSLSIQDTDVAVSIAFFDVDEYILYSLTAGGQDSIWMSWMLKHLVMIQILICWSLTPMVSKWIALCLVFSRMRLTIFLRKYQRKCYKWITEIQLSINWSTWLWQCLYFLWGCSSEHWGFSMELTRYCRDQRLIILHCCST